MVSFAKRAAGVTGRSALTTADAVSESHGELLERPSLNFSVRVSGGPAVKQDHRTMRCPAGFESAARATVAAPLPTRSTMVLSPVPANVAGSANALPVEFGAGLDDAAPDIPDANAADLDAAELDAAELEDVGLTAVC
jgi:hypothetical protein